MRGAGPSRSPAEGSFDLAAGTGYGVLKPREGTTANQVTTRGPPVRAETGWWKGLHPGMALASKGMVLAFVVFTLWNVEQAATVYAGVRVWIEASLDWYYILAVSLALFVCLFLLCSPYGKLRLGDDASRPEFSNFSWLAMLFSAGVGIGLLFFSIAEPLFYFDNAQTAGYPNNPHADRVSALTPDRDRAVAAMRVTYFHWGLHAWCVYVIVGLCLAYFGYRKKLPLTLRSALHPVIGERIYGPAGHAVDLLAVFGTVFGVATSLGLGAKQMAAGLHTLFGVGEGIMTQILLIAAVSTAATLSAVSGVGRGIRILSEWNVYFTAVLLAFFLFAGPFEWLVGFIAVSAGDYLWRVLPMGLWMTGQAGEADWQSAWTIFYWGWWISWAPFVGTFIARISRGRTLRAFVGGTLFVPSGLGLIWIGIFGGNAIHMELNAGAEGAGLLDLVRSGHFEAALYGTIDRLSDSAWLTWSVSALATLLLATWFITSSDSGTLVITTMLSMGDRHPPQRFRVVWGLGQGLVAAVLLLAGGLHALQTASIAAALPVSLVLLLITWGLLKSLWQDPSAVASSR